MDGILYVVNQLGNALSHYERENADLKAEIERLNGLLGAETVKVAQSGEPAKS